MRKILQWLGRVPGSIRISAQRALKITTRILQLLESREALIITQLIPGDVDDRVRAAMVGLLNSFKPALIAAAGKERKALAGRVGAELTAIQDGHKERMGQYTVWFEQVYSSTTA